MGWSLSRLDDTVGRPPPEDLVDPLERDESRAHQLQQLERELEVRRRLVHAENIGRYAPALNERTRRHTQRRRE